MDRKRMALREAVAEEVRVLIARRRLNQTVLAGAIGMSQSALSRRLSTEKPFDLDELEALANYFDVPLSALIPQVAYPGSESMPGLLSSVLVG